MAAWIPQTIGYLWLTLLAVWLLAAVNTKRKLQKKPIFIRIPYTFPVVLGYLLIFNPRLHFGSPGLRILPATLAWAEQDLVLDQAANGSEIYDPAVRRRALPL